MIEYFNTVQLTQRKGVNLVASATETPRGPPLGEAAEYVTTWCVHRLARPQQMDDDRAGDPANGPVNRAAGQGEDYLTYEVSAVSRMTQTR